jgi:hypothetical protein
VQSFAPSDGLPLLFLPIYSLTDKLRERWKVGSLKFWRLDGA